jgi:hypothetical protein
MKSFSLIYLVFALIALQSCKTKTVAQKTSLSSKEPTTEINAKAEKEKDNSPTLDDLELLGKGLLLTSVSNDPTYGYSKDNPVKVGSKKKENMAAGEYKFMNSLTGPNGEEISFRRLGSCCAFKTPNGFMGDGGLLDKFELTYKGLKEPIVLYLNMYDPGAVKAPKGLGYKK